MSLTFKPWIGNKYESEGIDGLKLLILGESHYGTKGKEKLTTTRDVVEKLGQKERHRFFTTTAKLVLGTGKKDISNSKRADFWDRVAFSNYIQCFVADNAAQRARPTEKMWGDAKALFPEILEFTNPDGILILGIDMAKRVPKIPSRIDSHSVKHPSQFFRYSDWQPGVQKFLSTIKGAV